MPIVVRRLAIASPQWNGVTIDSGAEVQHLANRRTSDYFHLGVIYIIWATSYLAMKFGLSGEHPFRPFQLQGARLLLGGAALSVLAYRQGRLRGFGWWELSTCVISTGLFWICRNGLALLAVRELPSGFVAMAMGTIPLWSAALQVIMLRQRPDRPVVLLLGFVGLILILWPVLAPSFGHASHLPHGSPIALWTLIVAPIAWVLASAMQAPLQQRMDGMMTAAVQLLLGGAYGTGRGRHRSASLASSPDWPAVLALLYLALIASALNFASYIKATTLFPVNVVAAFAYVNPILGVILGWLVLHERPAGISMFGMLVVTASVVLTLQRRSLPQKRHAPNPSKKSQHS